MRIQHNIMAMNAYRNYNTNTSALSKNLEKLSSGYKINRAGDDAAGLAISEKMRAQITGLNAAQKNVKDGISLVKTAEGAMQEIQDMLNRMDYLATQSANGTYDNEVDRANLQKEVDALKTEINRIADSANFNGIKLLDGSLADGVNKDIAGAQTDIPILQEAATDPTTEVGLKTVLHENATKAGKTSFDIEFHTSNITAKVGDKLKVSVGDTELEFTFMANGTASGNKDEIDVNADGTITLTAKDIATKVKDLFEDATDGADSEINGQAFTVKQDENKLSFIQDATPNNQGEVVRPDFDVKIEFTRDAANGPSVGIPAGGTAGNLVVKEATWSDTANKVDTSTGSALQSVTNVDKVVSSLDTDKMLAVLNKLNAEATGDVQIKKSASGNTYDLIVDGTVIATSDEDHAAIAAEQSQTYNFRDADGNSIGSLTITADTTAAGVAANTYDGGVNLGLTVVQGKNASSTAGADLAAAFEGVGANSGDVMVSYENDKYVISVGDQKIEANGTVVNGKLTLKTADGKDLLTIDANDATIKEDGFISGLSKEPFDTGLDFTASVSAANGTWNVHTTNNVLGAPDFSGNLASTKFDLKSDLIGDGKTITIGQETYIFKVGADSTTTAGKGQTLIDLSKVDEKNLLKTAGQLLSQQSANNKAFTIGFNDVDNTISIHEKEGQTVYTKGELNTIAGFDALIYANKAGQAINGRALTLQIGDTSDEFNQMKVSVGDMHTEAMGIADIDISNPEGASAAVQTIKDAINYVSGVRGDLGAVQNRLEHTANNLSVMAENIQDAESTIRDTDVAEEMMAYTKNNILIQSAQAMLAQANQVPQGVLQLLQ